jgi:hypothetical protein
VAGGANDRGQDFAGVWELALGVEVRPGATSKVLATTAYIARTADWGSNLDGFLGILIEDLDGVNCGIAQRACLAKFKPVEQTNIIVRMTTRKRRRFFGYFFEANYAGILGRVGRDFAGRYLDAHSRVESGSGAMCVG